ncbi:MAG: CapA family protein [Treponema sp.]|nr:CapA family protein [Treponema sp.]
MKKFFLILTSISLFFFISCGSKPKEESLNSTSAFNSEARPENQDKNPNITNTAPAYNSEKEKHKEDNSPRDTISLLFAGDIMAHNVNYNISTYSKIYRDVKYYIEASDLAFANIEAPIDTTKAASSYPNFNMTQKYVQAAVDAGFDVFSLCNNHTNDQGLNGILETIKTCNSIESYAKENGLKAFFSGIKDSPQASYTYNLIESHGWKILFFPMTELLNRPNHSDYINYIKTDSKSREAFVEYIRNLKEENSCDLFILSVHTCEPEYTRVVTDRQNQYYNDLIDAGVDIIWANHAHIIKNRKVIVDTEQNSDKLIMYSNGNTISGQRTKPDFASKTPTGERDNTGDGLFYKVLLKKDNKGSVKIQKAEAFFITTYINTANEYVIKALNQDFVDYLYDVPRTNWAKYIERRIQINKDATKDLIEWR